MENPNSHVIRKDFRLVVVYLQKNNFKDKCLHWWILQNIKRNVTSPTQPLTKTWQEGTLANTFYEAKSIDTKATYKYQKQRQLQINNFYEYV